MAGDHSTEPYQLIYKFVLDDPRGCDRDPSYPHISQDANIITIAQEAALLCDPTSEITQVRARSVKCLFLWECGWRRITPPSQ